jgi:hypothetical protein
MTADQLRGAVKRLQAAIDDSDADADDAHDAGENVAAWDEVVEVHIGDLRDILAAISGEGVKEPDGELIESLAWIGARAAWLAEHGAYPEGSPPWTVTDEHREAARRQLAAHRERFPVAP